MLSTLARAALLAALLALPAPAAAATLPEAPGAPGVRTTFTPADKHGFGTATALGSTVWFTLRAAELTEVYYPDLGTPAVRSLELAVTDGRTFVERERAGEARVERLDGAGLTFRQTVQARRWRLEKTYVTDPARDTVLVDVRFTSRTGRPLQVYALLDPALSNDGDDDRGRTVGDHLVSEDRRAALALAARPALGTSTSRYAGRRDAWRELREARRIRRPTQAAGRRGNVRQAARLALSGRPGGRRVTLALGFGGDVRAARRAARGSLRTGFAAAARAYGAGWQRYLAGLRPAPRSVLAHRPLYDASLMLLHAHEDKTYRGAGVASPSMPWAWGQLTVEEDLPSGPYHLVWSRDLYQVATAQIAAGDRAGAERALDYLLFRQQKRDGSFPQNSTVEGEQRWTSLQLDQVAFPLVLAWQLDRADPRRWARLRRAADFIVREGPRTLQERWENQSGWSPGTIAAEIAGLVCAADLARRRGDGERAARYERVADRWQRAVEAWTATDNGPWTPRPYYLRITKERDPNQPTAYDIGDSGYEEIDQRRVVGSSFLELVRLGVKRHDDPTILNTVEVYDDKLRVETPNGPFFHRFSYDGYGERLDGGPWDVGEPNTFRTFGRLWPILAGERGEYELLAGRPADAYLRAMAAAANDGGMIPEQVWDGRRPSGEGGLEPGEGTFSATPLAWSHAQFVRLAWSIDAGAPVEQPSIVACRYVRRC